MVTGCPSIYYYGRDFKIRNEKISKDLFKPILNGNLILKTDLLKKYQNSLFIDQGWFYEFILDARAFFIISLAFLDNKTFLNAYAENRIKIWG